MMMSSSSGTFASCCSGFSVRARFLVVRTDMTAVRGDINSTSGMSELLLVLKVRRGRHALGQVKTRFGNLRAIRRQLLVRPRRTCSRRKQQVSVLTFFYTAECSMYKGIVLPSCRARSARQTVLYRVAQLRFRSRTCVQAPETFPSGAG
ncbi:hypothetical protein K466DRAFT_210851 [Polyporus arcularius HHB13444]|uniref:Uncharacterized protein n=1 Tax=Polyporus arcularius HHB13444 TaxID=1314778 RepID=A0A5C3P799_9APHY|nr:hypothetical protein K466DRAFT_210851 [Polyporus arcularius HHB13444]